MKKSKGGPHYHNAGKELLMNGRHLADVITEQHAGFIAEALNAFVKAQDDLK